MSMFDISIKLSAVAKDATSKMKGFGNSLSVVSAKSKIGEKSMRGFQSEIKKTNNSFTNITKDANRSSKSIGNLTKSFKGLNQVIGIGKIYMVAQGMSNVVQSSMDAIETTNLFNVAMGESAEATNEFVNSVHDAFGFDTTNIQSAVGTFGLLARSMGMTNDNAEVLSTNTAKLAYDLSSLTNVPINQVMQDLRSGLVGQSETMYKYGVDVTEASLKQEALNQGITKSVRNMSQGEKMALRYATMIRQTGLSHGDFAKTINQPANQLRILGERFITLGRSIGNAFIPMLNKVLPYLNAFVSILIEVFNAIARLFGFEPAEVKNIANGFSGVEDGADSATDSVNGTTKALKKMKDITLGIDELNVIPDPPAPSGGGGGGGGGAGAGGLGDFDLSGYDNLMSKITSKADELKEKMIPVLKEILEVVLSIGGAFLLWKLSTGSGALLLVLPKLLSDLRGFVMLVKEFGLVKVLQDLFPVFTKIAGFALILYGLWNAFWQIKEIVETVTPSLAQFAEAFLYIAMVAGGLALIFTPFVGGVALVVGGLALIGIAIYKYRDKVLGFFQSIGATIVKGIDEFVRIAKDKFAQFIEFMKHIGELIVQLFDNAIELVKDLWNGLLSFLEELGSLIVTGITFVVTVISELWTSIITGIQDAWDAFLNFMLSLGQSIVDGFDTVVTGIKTAFTNASDGVKNIWSKVVGWFKTNIATPLSNIFAGVGNAIIAGVNVGLRGIETLVNGLVNMLNNFIKKANEVLVGIDALPLIDIKFRIPQMPYISLPRLARGGMLDAGQAFIAGEAGTELLGKYNNQTTVMPLENSGFVEAVGSAVYKAVVSAQESGGQVIEVVTQLDGEVIYKNQQKVSQNRGSNLGLGAFSR